MSSNIFRIIFCFLMSWTVTVKAQNTSEAKLFGQGVHAYNDGQFETALGIFNDAVKQGTDDPRVYLFRGLAYHQLGKETESLKDLREGAKLEAVDKRGFYPVSPALIRVQGKVRLQIENLRREAKANLVAIEKARAAARYEEQKANEAAALRRPATTDAPTTPRDPQQSIRPENPFAPGNIAGIKSNPSNVTVSRTNPAAAVDDKDPLANLKKTPMPTNPANNNNPPAGNNPFAPANPANNNPPANNTPPANNNPFAPNNNTNDAAPPADAPGNAQKSGGTLGAILGSFNPFGGSDAKPMDNNIPAGDDASSPLDSIKKLIQENLPGGGGGAPNNPGAPGGAPNPGNNPPNPAPNPFK